MLVPSETPCSTAQVWPAAYQLSPAVVSTPAIRARMVTSMPLLVAMSGEKAPAPVPCIRPSSVASATASAYQALSATSV